MGLAQRCLSGFDNRTRTRGAAYARSGRVRILNSGDECLDVTVQGSEYKPYAVTLDWSDAAGGRMTASCTCPRFANGYLCKHIWATIVFADAAKLDIRVPGYSQLQVQADEGVFDDEYEEEEYEDGEDEYNYNDDVNVWASVREEVKDRFGRAGKSGARQSANGVTRRPAWQKAFQELTGELAADDPQEVACRSRQLDRIAWYVINLSTSVAEQHLALDLLQQRRNMNGGFGKLVSLKYSAYMADQFHDPADRDVLTMLLTLANRTADGFNRYGYSYGYSYGMASVSQVVLSPAVGELLLPKLAASGRLAWTLNESANCEQMERLAWDAGPPWTLELMIVPDDAQQHWTLTGQLRRGDETRSASELIYCFPQGFVLFRNTLCRTTKDAAAWTSWLCKHHALTVPYSERDTFLRSMWQCPTLPPVVWPPGLTLEQESLPPQPRLRIRRPKNARYAQAEMVAEVDFQYGEEYVSSEDPRGGLVQEPADASGRIERVIPRDRSAEQARWAELEQPPAVRIIRTFADQQPQLVIKQKQLADVVARLVALGWQVEAEGCQYRSAGAFRAQVQSGINWFDLEATMDFDGIEAPLPALLAAARHGQQYVELGDGSRGMLPADWLKRYASLANLGEVSDGKVRFARSQALLLDVLLAEQRHLQVDRKFEEFRARLQAFSGVTAHDPPPTFRGTLRDYQRYGLGWLHFLRDLGLGGCLADDMGLGKTVQVLALLEGRRRRRLKRGEQRLPSLVVVPKSLVFNWMDEAQRFTPQLRVLNYTGLQRASSRAQLADAQLVVTTYGTLRQDIVSLKNQPFDYVILDESQAIKNSGSQVAKASLLLQAQHRLALTGTPIENHLGELWSLFEFLNPGMLGRSTAFASLCKAAKADDQESLSRLARAVAPFIFRRTKENVLTELPAKTEQTLYCDLAPKERKDYDQLRDYYRSKLSKVIDQRGLKKSKIHVLEALLRLRQAACHPGLLDKRKTGHPSAKLDLLLEQLEAVTGDGHKALVFSQFTSLLAIVRDRCDKKSIRYEYLDGQSRNRKAIVERFQQDASCPLFLISLKAGGHGLNLTAADYVFILDPWWNPAVEMQAIDRTHRIGQTRRVFAYRIIARDTVEEKVIALQNSKRDLANAIVTANDSLIRKLTVEDLQLILS